MRTEKVNFYSEGIKLAGVLYLPIPTRANLFRGSCKGRAFSDSKTPNTTS